MNNEFMVHTGAIIEEYLEAYGINPKECSRLLEVNEKYLSDFLNGNEILTEDVAYKFEKIFNDIPASYWINYEKKYQTYRKNLDAKLFSIDENDLIALSKRFKFSSIFNGLDWSLKEQALEMLKLLKLESFSQFEEKYANLNVDFMEDGGELEAISIWLNLAEEEIEIQNKDLTKKQFNKENLYESLDSFKKLALNTDYITSLNSARKLLNRFGVYLVFEPAIENSKVRGALTTYSGKPAIFISGRFKTHDHVWFALMHEIGHLLMHYVPNEIILTMEPEFILSSNKDIKEDEANEFARDFFIDKLAYSEFIKNTPINKNTISDFAIKQNVLPGIVVARLQHDGIIGFEELNYLKNK